MRSTPGGRAATSTAGSPGALGARPRVRCAWRRLERLAGASTVAVLSGLVCAVTAAGASPEPYEAARAPGVHASVDCANGLGLVWIDNTDMAGSRVAVTIDGGRRPDLPVDSGGRVHQWYDLVPNQAHRLTIVYDFVPGGTADEQDQVMTVSCLDGQAPPPGEDQTAGTLFTSLPPTRVWDSRVGPGPTGPLGPGHTRDITVTGVAGVPPGATAVVLNLTAVNPTTPTHVTAWPTGQPRPLASNLNVPPGDVRANLVTVKIGTDGNISFTNHAGHLDLIADIAGYYGTTGTLFTSLPPTRVWDSRVGPGPTGPLGPGHTRDITVTGVTGVAGVPPGATAVVLNLTAINPTAPTHITAWPTGQPRPLASNLNVPPGDVRANLVTVKIGTDGNISFTNHAGHLDLIADIAGYYDTTGTLFTSLPPTRVWDTRVGPGPTGPLGPGHTRDITVTGVAGVPPGATAVVLNLTAVNPTAPTHVTAWPTGQPRPLASNLNVPPGDVRANLVTVKIGTDGNISFTNHAGHLDLIADIAGYYSAAR